MAVSNTMRILEDAVILAGAVRREIACTHTSASTTRSNRRKAMRLNDDRWARRPCFMEPQTGGHKSAQVSCKRLRLAIESPKEHTLGQMRSRGGPATCSYADVFTRPRRLDRHVRDWASAV